MQNNQDNIFGNASGVNPDINPLEYPAVKCSNCRCEFFTPALMFRQIPGSLFGRAGETVQYPMKVFCCRNCGALSPDDQAIYDELVLKAANKENKSSIII